MPAASYREGPDGHSSRKQNSKRRRAKCSPSFVSGRVIGHGDISLRCIPECSAMAPRRAVPAACPSRASTLSFVLLAGRSPSPAFGAVFFAGRAAVIWCGANPGARPWQHLRECALGRLAVAIFSRDAFPSVYPWQYSATVRSRAAIRDNFFASCIPKAASDGKIASSRQDSRAMHPKTGSLWQDMRAMHPKSPANRLSGTHGAKILPGRSPFRCTGPSNHARRADLAVRRSVKPPERPRPRRRRTVRAARARSPGPRNTAQEAAPSSPPGQQVPPAAPAVPPPLFADSVTCGDSIHAATAPPIRRAALAQREGYLPYLWHLSSVLLADAIGL